MRLTINIPEDDYQIMAEYARYVANKVSETYMSGFDSESNWDLEKSEVGHD